MAGLWIGVELNGAPELWSPLAANLGPYLEMTAQSKFFLKERGLPDPTAP